MFRILDRYILRELGKNMLAVAVVLSVVVAGGTFARVLEKVAAGSYPAGIMFDVLGLKLISAMAALLPLALFLGVLMGLGRLYHESEMHVLSASGMGFRGISVPTVLVTVPVVAVVALITLWWGPLAERTSDSVIDQANNSVIVAGLEAGRFTQLPGQNGTMFVTDMNRGGDKLDGVFLAEDGGSGGDDDNASVRVIRADRGKLYGGTLPDRRFMALFQGHQYTIPLDGDDWSQLSYARNDIALTEVRPESDKTREGIGETTPTSALLAASGPNVRAELAWRFAAPAATLVLVLLALPLARQTPREPRYGRLMLAVLCYFLYFSVLSLGRSLIAQGTLPNDLPIWALHLVVAIVSLRFLWRQYARRRRWRLRS